MGFRFRKSFKIAPGVKFNVNKKSVGLTFGKRGAHFTINSKGKRTTSLGIPGTGLSYTSTSGGGGKKKSKKRANTVEYNTNIQKSTQTVETSNNANSTPKTLYQCIYLVVGIFLIIWGLIRALFAPGFIIFALIGIYCINKSRQYTNNLDVKNSSSEQNNAVKEDPINLKASDDKPNVEEINNTINKFNISTYFKQVEETVDILKNSKNVDTVISRLQFLKTLRDKLEDMSCSEVNGLINNINDILNNKTEVINVAIQRSLDSELEKIKELKTERGRLNRLNRFFENIKSIDGLAIENISFIEKLKQETKII